MTLAPGARLGPYRIEARLGAGGMGVVYRADDTRLGRAVAIKTLAPEAAVDPERRSRFEREAKAIAALNHPRICSLYDIGSEAGVDFLVMELLDGETLAGSLEGKALTLARALELAIEIAEGLAVAHRRGIVHRDLKPANVMVTRSGVKLLDFGLARLRPVLAAEDVDGKETLAATRDGVVLGTPLYMAPEQVQGKTADAPADVFALGVLVFEMVTGQRPFSGGNPIALSGAILHAPAPRLSELRPDVPPALDRVVAACLAKDPDDRFSSAQDVLIPLRWIAEQVEKKGAAIAQQRVSRRERVAWWAAGLSAATAAVLGLLLLVRAEEPGRARRVDRTSIVPSGGIVVVGNEAPQISPDGRHVAFVGLDASGNPKLFVRDRDALEVRALPGTEGATHPFWAPDSRRLGFFSAGKLRTTSLDGGSPNVLADAPVPRGGSWSSRDEILFVGFPRDLPAWIPASGGTPTPVAAPEDAVGTRWFPRFLPDGRHYLFLAVGFPDRGPLSASVASVDSMDIKPLVEASASTLHAPSGHLLFRRGEDLLAQRLNPTSLALEGSPARVAESVGFGAVTYEGLFSVSNEGTIAYLETQDTSELVWFDRTGRRLGSVTPRGIFGTLCLTNDERRVVYDLADPVTPSIDLWTMAVEGGTPSRLTFDPATDFYPVCPRGSDDVVFTSLRAGTTNPFRANTSFPGSERQLLSSPSALVATDLSADGLLAYSQYVPGNQFDVAVVPAAGGDPIVVAGGPSDERLGRLSPDSRWIAYLSNETGRYEVFVQPFPPTGVKWQASSGGGLEPRWRRDGRALYYTTADNRLIAVEVTTAGSSVSFGPAVTVLQARFSAMEAYPQGTPYDVTADGERILVNVATEESPPIHLLTDWRALLESEGGGR